MLILSTPDVKLVIVSGADVVEVTTGVVFNVSLDTNTYVSTPVPPVIVSAPAPPVMLFVPLPPSIESAPAAPPIVSLPSPPMILSGPAPPVKESLPTPPVMDVPAVAPPVKDAPPVTPDKLTVVRAFVPEFETATVVRAGMLPVTVIVLRAAVVAVVSAKVTERASVEPDAARELKVTDSTPTAETVDAAEPEVVVAVPTLTVKLSAVPEYVAAVKVAAAVAVAAGAAMHI